MPYPMHPPWAARTLFVLRALLYVACLVMTATAGWMTPRNLFGQLPVIYANVWGVIAVAGALSCLAGAVTRRYRFELNGLPVTIAAVIVYANTLWETAADTVARVEIAAVVCALLAGLTIRLVELLVVRSRLVKESRDAG